MITFKRLLKSRPIHGQQFKWILQISLSILYQRKQSRHEVKVTKISVTLAILSKEEGKQIIEQS